MDLIATNLAGKLKVVKIDTEQYPTFGTSRLTAGLLFYPFLFVPWRGQLAHRREHASLLVA